MKKFILLTFTMLLWFFAFPQESDRVDNPEKKITLKTDLTNKTQFEKMFWGFTNSPVEFYSAGIKAQGGLRLFKTWPERRWKLEIIPFQDYWVEMDMWERRIVTTGRNREIYAPTVLRTTFVITDRFGDLLREKTRAMIDGYNEKGTWGDDGGVYGFRCLVGDEMWSLFVWEPRRLVEQMSDLFHDIIMDVSTSGNIDEDRYVARLGSIIF